MFAPNGKQEITYQDFLKVYQETPDFKNNPNEAESLARDFETLDPVNKFITPEQFLEILKVQNAPPKKN